MNCFLWHKWGFPRRWAMFDGEFNVDVQRCTYCGVYRKSVVQFGIQPPVDFSVPVSLYVAAKEREA